MDYPAPRGKSHKLPISIFGRFRWCGAAVCLPVGHFCWCFCIKVVPTAPRYHPQHTCHSMRVHKLCKRFVAKIWPPPKSEVVVALRQEVACILPSSTSHRSIPMVGPSPWWSKTQCKHITMSHEDLGESRHVHTIPPILWGSVGANVGMPIPPGPLWIPV